MQTAASVPLAAAAWSAKTPIGREEKTAIWIITLIAVVLTPFYISWLKRAGARYQADAMADEAKLKGSFELSIDTLKIANWSPTKWRDVKVYINGGPTTGYLAEIQDVGREFPENFRTIPLPSSRKVNCALTRAQWR